MFSLLNQLLDACIVINESGIVQFWNAAAENKFGFKAAEVIGQNVKMLMPKVRTLTFLIVSHPSFLTQKK